MNVWKKRTINLSEVQVQSEIPRV